VIRLDISKIKGKTGEEQHYLIECRLPPQRLGFDEISFCGPLQLDLTAVAGQNSIKLTGRLDANIEVACSRCLELFTMLVRAKIDEVFYNSSQPDVEPGEEWIPYKGEQLDITDEVIRTLFSELPMKPVCRADCRGLCQSCGSNLNYTECGCSKEETDPRLEVLKKLLE